MTNSSADSLRRYLAFTLAAREQEQPPAFLWHLNRPKGARGAGRPDVWCESHVGTRRSVQRQPLPLSTSQYQRATPPKTP